MLSAFINQSGKSRAEWAARLGITKGYLSLLVTGQKVPSLRIAVIIERETGGAIPPATWLPGEALPELLPSPPSPSSAKDTAA